VRIPRCRATVSEDMQSATGKLGRLIVVSGRKSLLASQETGVNRNTTLSRAKESDAVS